MSFDRVELSVIFQESMHMIEHNPELKKLAKESVANTEVFNDCTDVTTDKYCNKSEGHISVVAGTTFDTARQLHAKYAGKKKVAVLNFANAYKPGGGVVGGARAQEECLCRCSTLYKSLKKVSETPYFYALHTVQRKLDQHDLNQKGIIYTPDVAVFRTDDYEVLDKPVLVDVITCAAPEMFKYDCTEEELRAIHEEKAKAIFDIAIDNDVDIIVLGAFGCGAFKNPPDIVAHTYGNVLNIVVRDGVKYKNCFEEVVFAIRSNNEFESKNFKVFKDSLDGM